MTIDDIRAIVALVTYKPGWSFRVEEEGGRPFLQASVSVESDLTMDPTGKTKDRTPWKSGKRFLSLHMCRQEIIGSVLGLVKDAEAHETHEWFRYRGASIYNPHLDPDALAEVARKASSFNVRVNAMTMEEAK